MKNNKGYTLTETLVVIGIIGIMTSTVLGAFINFRDKHQPPVDPNEPTLEQPDTFYNYSEAAKRLYLEKLGFNTEKLTDYEVDVLWKALTETVNTEN